MFDSFNLTEDFGTKHINSEELYQIVFERMEQMRQDLHGKSDRLKTPVERTTAERLTEVINFWLADNRLRVLIHNIIKLEKIIFIKNTREARMAFNHWKNMWQKNQGRTSKKIKTETSRNDFTALQKSQQLASIQQQKAFQDRKVSFGGDIIKQQTEPGKRSESEQKTARLIKLGFTQGKRQPSASNSISVSKQESPMQNNTKFSSKSRSMKSKVLKRKKSISPKDKSRLKLNEPRLSIKDTKDKSA